MSIILSNGKITRPRIALQKSVNMTDPTTDKGTPSVTHFDEDTGFQLTWSFDCNCITLAIYILTSPHSNL